jgi:hypothetical protein
VLSHLIIDKHQRDVIQRSLIRHDADKLAEVIMGL